MNKYKGFKIMTSIVFFLSILSVGLLLAEEKTEKVTIKVEGMACPFCENAVESVLKKMDGVISSKASALDKQVVVEYDPEKITPEEIVDTINKQTFYRAHLPNEGDDVRSEDEGKKVEDKGLQGEEVGGRGLWDWLFR